jgi:hypothetical protein
MHKSVTKCNETIGKWCKNKHGASKIIDTFETYHRATAADLDRAVEATDLDRAMLGGFGRSSAGDGARRSGDKEKEAARVW